MEKIKKNIKLLILLFFFIVISLILAMSALTYFLYKKHYNVSATEKPYVSEVKNKDIPIAIFNALIKPAPEEKVKLKFLFFGDMMLDRNVGKKIKSKGLDYLFEKLRNENNGQDQDTINRAATTTTLTPSQLPQDTMAAKIKPAEFINGATAIDTTYPFFQGVDLIACNLEGAVTDNGAHYAPKNAYDFAFAPKLIDDLKNYKFNFFTLANNHFTDQGKRGVEETRKNLTDMKFNFSGCADAETGDCSSTILEVSGKKIGMLGFSAVYHNLNEKDVINIVKKTASSTDLVIVNMHWGVEYDHTFNKVQQNLARKIIDAGADIIIGHHPHVVQGMEIYNGHPIFYSLGNFIFDQYFSPDTQEGLAAGITINQDNIDIFLYPLASKANQVELMKGQDKEKFFSKFIKWSHIEQEHSQKIKNGHLIIQNFLLF